MQRRPTNQDVSWLIDLHQKGQLDLDPPYQRRSVWTRRDRLYFIDTIFRNYPSPAIFLHKTIDDSGQTLYHVIDGKQRLETILMFVADKLRISQEFGDLRLNGKKWSELDVSQKRILWNYQVTVELIDVVEGMLVNEIFDRLNRNALRLTRQELRHAKYDGWLIREAENEEAQEEWRLLGVVTTARIKRMADVQFISELLLVLLEGQILGFDQDLLDNYYAEYDEPTVTRPEFDENDYRRHLKRAKDYLQDMESHNGVISNRTKPLAHFYTLWCLVTLNNELPKPADLAEAYEDFMARVEMLSSIDDLTDFMQTEDGKSHGLAYTYLDNFGGANTDLGPRLKRYEMLRKALLS